MEAAQYASELNAHLTYLFEWARSIGELDMAASLFGEFRGSQDGGWSTIITAYQVRDELKAFDKKGSPLTVAELRQALCLYSQLAEAGGVYEGLLNLMGVIQMKPYNLWPFQNLVRVTQSPKRIIGPNANAMFRRLAQVASEIGMKRLAELLEITFRDDIRNGIFHADYILAPDGLRLRRRNGGYANIVSYDQIDVSLTNGLNFFQLLEDHQRNARESFRPAREIIGRFSMNPPMPYMVELKPDGRFSISSRGIGRQTDRNYDRQERINNLLSGRVLALYSMQDQPSESAIVEGINRAGFDPLIVDVRDGGQRTALLAEISSHDLWRPGFIDSAREEHLLLATPSGFARVADTSEFLSLLPKVEALEFAQH